MFPQGGNVTDISNFPFPSSFQNTETRYFVLWVLQCHTFIIFLANKSKFLRSKINILSCLHSNARFIRGKSWKIRLFPKPVSKIAKTSILPTRCFKTISLLFAFSLHVWKVTQRCVCCHHCHIAFLSVMEDASLLTKTVKIN